MNHPLFNLTKNQIKLEKVRTNLISSGLHQIAVFELVIVDTDGLEVRISKLHDGGAKEKEVALVKEIYLGNPKSYSQDTFAEYFSQLRREHPDVFGKDPINWIKP